MKYKTSDILAIANRFQMEGVGISAKSFGSGHINDTFKITTGVSEVEYLFQRINHQIFHDVQGLMNNIAIVCNHIKGKLRYLGENEVNRKSMTIIPTYSGELYCKDDCGNYWRMFLLISGMKSYDVLSTEEQAFSGGEAFGKFQKQLADLDSKLLVEILPKFHDVDFRLDNLRRAIQRDGRNRVVEVTDLIDFIFARECRMRTILVKGREGKLKVRITHNDTKFNNVLLDENDEVQCVVDLDTVMPGYVAYDFGDAIRTVINAATEDESNLDLIQLNIPLFRAYTEGYLKEATDFLTTDEHESLLHGVFLLPYMQGVRFLTDYLEGDHYYKVAYPEHNLVRARAQLKLVSELEAVQDELKSILRLT